MYVVNHTGISMKIMRSRLNLPTSCEYAYRYNRYIIVITILKSTRVDRYTDTEFANLSWKLNDKKIYI